MPPIAVGLDSQQPPTDVHQIDRLSWHTLLDTRLRYKEAILIAAVVPLAVLHLHCRFRPNQ